MKSGLAVVGLPSDSYAFNNMIYVSPELFTSMGGENPEGVAYIELNDFILPVKGDKKVPRETIAVGNFHRMMMKISKIDKLNPKGNSSSFIIS